MKKKKGKLRITPQNVPEGYWEPMWRGKPITTETDPLLRTGETWCNNKCQVFVYDWESPPGWPPIVNLSMKLNNREAWHDWRDFYRIKSELCGTLSWGFEVYPDQHSLVDTANQYHMFVCAPGYQFPVSLKQRGITDYSKDWQETLSLYEEKVGKEQARKMINQAKQRDWSDHHKCDELPQIGPVWAARGFVILEGRILRLKSNPQEEDN